MVRTPPAPKEKAIVDEINADIHDDAEREYAYDGGTEKALQLSPSAGWVVVSMKNDWKKVF